MTTLDAPAGDAPAFEVPTSMSPSRVESFTSCPMAFRFANIERVGDPPNVHTTRGSLVHRALELGYLLAPERRTPAGFTDAVDRAIAEYRSMPDFTLLGFGDDEAAGFFAACHRLVDNYLRMENPQHIRPIGLELRLSAQVGDLSLRGIIDRLELRDGGLVVTDYKTGRPPSSNWELRSLAGVHFYAFLCQQVFGQLPVAVRLLYLSSGEIIEAVPSEQSARFVVSRTAAVWRAVEKACTSGTFTPRPGALCASCRYQRWCPAFGGDPDLAHLEAPVAFGLAAA